MAVIIPEPCALQRRLSTLRIYPSAHILGIMTSQLDHLAHVVSYYYMNGAGSLKRTSMSLDQETLNSLESLASKWNTSKSEVIRRAVRKSKMEDDSKPAPKSPVEALKWLRENGLTKKDAEAFKKEIRSERNATRYWWE